MIKRSDDISELAGALALAQSNMGAAELDCQNPHFKSSYSSLTAVREACKEPLAKQGLAVLQPVSTAEDGSFKIETILLHKSGQWLSSELKLLLDRQNSQGLGSAISYARRYALSSLLGIVSDEDDDGNAASSEEDLFNKEPSKAFQLADAGAYKVRFGQFKGKTLKELGEKKVRDYVEFLEKSAGDKQQPLSGPVYEFAQAAWAYLAPTEALHG